MSNMQAPSLIRKGWALYLALYIAVALVSLYPYIRYFGGFQLLPFLSTLLDVVAIVCLFRHVRRLPVPSLTIRLVLIVFAFLFAARWLFVVFLLLPTVWPWQAGSEQWVSAVGLTMAMLQVPMAVALFAYTTGTQKPRRTEAPA